MCTSELLPGVELERYRTVTGHKVSFPYVAIRDTTPCANINSRLYKAGL
jgi:hypothetical protein